MKRADKLFSLMIRARDGACVARGDAGVSCAGNLQCAHLISRSYKSIRVDPDNAVALCAAHHTFWTHRPLEWEAWVEARFPGRWARLRKRALDYERVNWKAEFESLRSVVGQ
jgi:hypothetical protein